MASQTLHLLRLTPSTSLQTFLTHLSSLPILYAGQVKGTLIPPSNTDTSSVNNPNQEFSLVILLNGGSSPNWSPAAKQCISHSYTLPLRIPSRIISKYKTEPKGTVQIELSSWPAYKQQSQSQSQNDKESGAGMMDPQMKSFLEKHADGEGEKKEEVVMLNLLRFNPSKRSQYEQGYGKRFSQDIGHKRGARVIFPGLVSGKPIISDRDTDTDNTGLGNKELNTEITGGRDISKEKENDNGAKWDQIALVRYPHLLAFADMVVADEYREINRRYRAGALQDTVLICTTELHLGGAGGSAKL